MFDILVVILNTLKIFTGFFPVHFRAYFKELVFIISMYIIILFLTYDVFRTEELSFDFYLEEYNVAVVGLILVGAGLIGLLYILDKIISEPYSQLMFSKEFGGWVITVTLLAIKPVLILIFTLICLVLYLIINRIQFEMAKHEICKKIDEFWDSGELAYPSEEECINNIVQTVLHKHDLVETPVRKKLLLEFSDVPRQAVLGIYKESKKEKKL